MGEPTRLRLKVRHYEVDAYGHVNHANYVHYLEVARIEALEGVGLSLPEMRRQGYLIIAVDLSLRYHAAAHGGETLEVRTHIRELRGARSVWAQAIHEAATERLVVTAEVTGAFTTEGRRPVRMPAGFRERLLALYVPDAADSSGIIDADAPIDTAVGSADNAEAGEPESPGRRWWRGQGTLPGRPVRPEPRSGGSG